MIFDGPTSQIHMFMELKRRNIYKYHCSKFYVYSNKSSRNLATFVFLGSHNSNRNGGAPKQQSLILLESMFQTTIFDSTKVIYISMANKSHVDGNTM